MVARSNRTEFSHPVGVLVELALADRFAHVSDCLFEVGHGEGDVDLVLDLLDPQNVHLARCNLLPQRHHGGVTTHVRQIGPTVAVCDLD